MPGYKCLSDHELAVLLKEGEEKAFTEIYERYHSLLYIYAHKKLRDKQEAQDIVQEVLSVLWNKRYQLAEDLSLTAYLFTAVRNKALDIFSHRKVEAKYLSAVQHLIDSSVDSADFLVREHDLKRLIEKEIEALPPRMREAFRLSRELRLSHKDVAARMEISEQTASTQIKKALRILKMRVGTGLWTLLLVFLD